MADGAKSAATARAATRESHTAFKVDEGLAAARARQRENLFTDVNLAPVTLRCVHFGGAVRRDARLHIGDDLLLGNVQLRFHEESESTLR